MKQLTWDEVLPGVPAEPPQAAEFLQKRLNSEFFGFQWQNLAEILSLFLGGNFGSFLAHFRSFGAIYGHFLAL